MPCGTRNGDVGAVDALWWEVVRLFLGSRVQREVMEMSRERVEELGMMRTAIGWTLIPGEKVN